MGYWLFKTEPDAFSIDDLQARKCEPWDGVRNYQARNFLRDEIAVDDLVFIYHSSCKQVGIAGVAKVTQTGLIDALQFDPESKYYDVKSNPDNPRWYCVEIGFVEKFSRVLPLSTIKALPEITELALVKKGSRLSIMPVTPQEWDVLYTLASS